MIYLISAIVFTIVYLLTLQFFPRQSEKVIRRRLEYGIEQRRPKIPLLTALLRLVSPINKLVRFRPLRKKIKVKLTSAGSSLAVDEFLLLKEIFTVLLPGLYVFLVGWPHVQVLWLFAFLVLGFILPDLWLQQKIKKRHNAIARALPHVIDLLNLAVGAGLDFMVAVKKMIKRCKPNPLVDELNQLWQQTNMGKTRQEALRNMAKRVNMPQISTFVRTLVQADKMGTGIEEALSMQSDEILTWRFQRGETQALKAPIKLLFPLIAFILPAVMVVVAGPIVLQLLSGGFSGLNF